MTDRLNELADHAELTGGLEFGLLALAYGIVLGLAWRLVRRGEPAPVGGLLIAAAAALAMRREAPVPNGLVDGLWLLGGAGLLGWLLGRIRPWLSVVGTVVSIPGAWAISSRGDLPDVDWVKVLVFVMIVVGGGLVAEADRRHAGLGVGPALFAISAGGVFVTVPDTERALVLIGAAAPLAFLGWPWPAASLGAGSYAAVGVLAWTAGYDGRGRLSSVVGSVACLGLLAIEPIARVVLGGRTPLPTRSRTPWSLPVVAGAHAVVVLLAARVAGLRPDVRSATVIAVLVGVGGVVVTALAAGVVDEEVSQEKVGQDRSDSSESR